MSNRPVLLGVNIDHVATIRQARGTPYPDLPKMVGIVEKAGADGITLHLREDRRHIQDLDVAQLRASITTKMNFEMAPTEEMIGIACDTGPEDCCLVPEKREELTTEGGLEVIAQQARLTDVCRRLKEHNIIVSIFIEPSIDQISAAADAGAPVVELHTGTYADTEGDEQQRQLERLFKAAEHAHSLGLVVNAGHGIDYHNVAALKTMPHVNEFNIGHSIVAQALFDGMHKAVADMKVLLQPGS